jgi:hypothetical protein
MPLVVQSFGNATEYRRAIFCVLSYYAHSHNPLEVFLFTDNEGFFEIPLQGIPVKFFLLSPEDIVKMRGEIDFLHRIKIAVIEKAMKNSEEPICYVDSDTFFISDPDAKIALANSSMMFMHLREYSFSRLQNECYSGAFEFYNAITNNRFYDVKGNEIAVTENHTSWNAGAMIFHNGHAEHIPDVYNLTDQFYRLSQSHASEQYAFSVVFQNAMQINPCDDVIYHYWYKIKKRVLDAYFEKMDLQRILPLNNRIVKVRALTAKFPSLLENHAWILKDKAIQAFHRSEWQEGYRYAIKAILKNPFDWYFFKDLLYHTKRLIRESIN